MAGVNKPNSPGETFRVWGSLNFNVFILSVSPVLYLFIDLWKHDETCIYNKESEGQT